MCVCEREHTHTMEWGWGSQGICCRKWLQVLQSENVVTASWSNDCSYEWDINSATGSSRQEVLWEEECCSNLIMKFREANDDSLHLLCWMENATGIFLRSFRCTEEEGWGTVCIMWERCISTQKDWEHQRFGFKLVSPVKHLFLNLEDYRVYGKVRTRVITCPVVPGVVPVYTYYLSASSFSPRSVLICMLNYMVTHLDTVFQAPPLTCIVTLDKLLYLFELHMPHLTHKIVIKIQWATRWQTLSPVLAQKKRLES